MLKMIPPRNLVLLAIAIIWSSGLATYAILLSQSPERLQTEFLKGAGRRTVSTGESAFCLAAIPKCVSDEDCRSGRLCREQRILILGISIKRCVFSQTGFEQPNGTVVPTNLHCPIRPSTVSSSKVIKVVRSALPTPLLIMMENKAATVDASFNRTVQLDVIEKLVASEVGDGYFQLNVDNADMQTLGEDLCVAVHHLHDTDVVYNQHQRAFVLCDQNESCATPGHFVIYKGRPMMMRSYCRYYGRGECLGKVMWVNSPKFQPGLYVNSNTKGLSFTAHSARFQSFLEEKFLALAINLGIY